MNQAQFETSINLGDIVEIRWTFCGGYYGGEAKVVKINKKSFTCEMLEEVETYYGGDDFWPVGFKMRAPKLETKEWSRNNGIFSLELSK